MGPSTKFIFLSSFSGNRRIDLGSVRLEDIEGESTSFSVRMFSKLLNGVFFIKIFYRKVALKNHINLFLKFKIINTQLIMI